MEELCDIAWHYLLSVPTFSSGNAFYKKQITSNTKLIYSWCESSNRACSFFFHCNNIASSVGLPDLVHGAKANELQSPSIKLYRLCLYLRYRKVSKIVVVEIGTY